MSDYLMPRLERNTTTLALLLLLLDAILLHLFLPLLL
jgi:hypothetical protein